MMDSCIIVYRSDLAVIQTISLCPSESSHCYFERVEESAALVLRLRPECLRKTVRKGQSLPKALRPPSLPPLFIAAKYYLVNEYVTKWLEWRISALYPGFKIGV